MPRPAPLYTPSSMPSQGPSVQGWRRPSVHELLNAERQQTAPSSVSRPPVSQHLTATNSAPIRVRARTSPGRLPPMARSPSPVVDAHIPTSAELLAFSKKPRDVDYVPYSTPVTKQPYTTLGGLGPDLQNEELLEKVFDVGIV